MTVSTSIPADAAEAQELTRSYHEADRDFRIQQAQVGCVLVLACMPLGIGLDWFVYPGQLGRLLVSRLLCDAAVMPIYALLRTPRGRAWIDVLGFIWPLFPAIAISWMVYATEGSTSPYYAGLNLVLIVACQLMPYTRNESLGVCGATLAAYLLACVMHPSRAGQPVDAGLLFNNVYFMALTALICATSCHFGTQRRLQEFKLRRELDVRNRQLDESYQQLSHLDKLKSEFFANLSHELRTPLTLILSPVEDLLAHCDDLPAAAREALGMVRQNGLRLLKLITDLLEIVRLEEGRLQLRPEPLDLQLFLPATVDSVRHLAGLKGLSMRLESVQGADAGGALVIDADPGRMEKVLLNVLTNAIKFTPPGGSITTRWGRENGHAVLEVRDTGVGIPAKELPFIFERFRQADSSSTRKFQGMGIGLALARELVQEHGGRMTARSAADQGTTIRIELPISSQPAAPNAAPRTASTDDPIAALYHNADRVVGIHAGPSSAPADAAPAPAEPAAAGSVPTTTVLVVDDEPDMRRFLVSTLSAEHRVLEAADGTAGLEIARTRRPDLALLDLMLPGVDGLEMCRALKSDEATRGIKVVLLTARTDERSKLTALQHGADDFLTKPFSTTEVKTRLANLLRSAALEEKLRRRNEDLENTLAKLKETEVQLVQSEKMSGLGKIAAGLLHEINNPLNFTFMALQIAEQQAGDRADLRETLKDIDEGMSRIRTVVTDLRGFAYPSRQSLTESFGVDEALTTSLRLASQELVGVNVVRGNMGDAVLGSKTQIDHVLMNLLVNAAYAVRGVTDGRQPQIEVACRPSGDRLLVSVRDNGTGVKPEDLPRLFEPFFTTRDVGQGMGMGLSICHTIVRNHGGSIRIQSEHGSWTEVTFDLPLADAQSEGGTACSAASAAYQES